jgi:lactoylglutathione lyase
MKTLHVAYRVTDLAVSLEFYLTLGFREVGRVSPDAGTTLTMLKFPGEEVATLELVHRPTDGPVQIGTGFSHLVVQVNELATSIMALWRRGIEPEPEREPGGSGGPRTSWLTDPDGYRIELVQWPAGHADGITAADFVSSPTDTRPHAARTTESHARWIDRIGARSLGAHPIAARKRKRPASRPPLLVEHMTFDFRPWDGPAGSFRDDFGKGLGQVYSLDGAEPVRSCNEVEVAKKLQAIRQHAYWFSQFQPTLVPEIWRPWVRSLRVDAPAWLAAMDRSLRRHMAAPLGGMPDVVAWDDADPMHSALFVECKASKESLLEAQEDRAHAAAHVGIELHQLPVSVR